ncbi:MAG: hypothetical protein V1800_09685, partial [Candidatus Latescibacterota bacterium]
KSGYEGWYIMDVFPYRENGLKALQQCVTHTERFISMAHTLLKSDLGEAMARADAVSSYEILWKMLFR